MIDELNPQRLVVEGKNDLLCVLGLLRGRSLWNDASPEFFIKEMGGTNHTINAPFIRTQLKQSGLKTLGVMVDADDNLEGKWESFCSIVCKTAASKCPDLPKDGFVTTTDSGLRVGFWCMPNCFSPGMMETFLATLIPSDHEPLWNHAIESGRAAKKDFLAPYRETHIDKMAIHTWLAWQDPPGEPLYRAIKTRMLNPASLAADPFISWLSLLFDIGK